MSKTTTALPNYQAERDQLVTQLTEMLPLPQFEIFNADAQQLAASFPNPLRVSVGDPAPAFSLPNATGTLINSSNLLKKGSLVLTFYRGEWCPYCNLYLNQLQRALETITANNASLVAISPQKPDNSLSIKEKNNLQFSVLSDVGNRVAKQYVQVFKYGDAPLKAMADLGYDFDSFYSEQNRELPVPATFIIKPNGTISFAQSEGGDYRERVDIAAIISSLQS